MITSAKNLFILKTIKKIYFLSSKCNKDNITVFSHAFKGTKNVCFLWLIQHKCNLRTLHKHNNTKKKLNVKKNLNYKRSVCHCKIDPRFA